MNVMEVCCQLHINMLLRRSIMQVEILGDNSRRVKVRAVHSEAARFHLL